MTDAATPSRPARTVAEVQAEIAEARDSLAATIAELRRQATPAAVARRGLSSARGWFVDEYGGIRPERVAIVAVSVIGLVVIGRMRGRRH